MLCQFLRLVRDYRSLLWWCITVMPFSTISQFEAKVLVKIFFYSQSWYSGWGNKQDSFHSCCIYSDYWHITPSCCLVAGISVVIHKLQVLLPLYVLILDKSWLFSTYSIISLNLNPHKTNYISSFTHLTLIVLTGRLHQTIPISCLMQVMQRCYNPQSGSSLTRVPGSTCLELEEPWNWQYLMK